VLSDSIKVRGDDARGILVVSHNSDDVIYDMYLHKCCP
jgi:hypothetical protein